MTTNAWVNAVSGDWTDGADWSSGAPPSATDTVTIAAQGAYVVTLYTTGIAAGLVLNDAGLLFYDAGNLAVSGTIALQAGTLDLAFGTLQGGTLALAGGTLQSTGGTLNGVCVEGPLQLTAIDTTMYVENGLTLEGLNGSGAGSVVLTGIDSELDFLGSQTFANTTIALGSAGGGVATLGVSHPFGASNGATLTLAASDWVSQTGGDGVLAIGGPMPTPPLSDAMINQGTITATGGTLALSGAGTFFNQGTIGISGGATLDIASTGFTNTGTITVSNATLDFGGTFASALLGKLGPLALSDATVEIGGDDINTGNTLTLGASSALGPVALAGTITGGTIIDTGGGLTFGPGTGVLVGVSYQGTLNLSAPSSAVTLTGNTTLFTNTPGTATVTGAGAALLLQGSDILGNATITLGSNSIVAELGTTDSWAASTATTATLGNRLVVQQAGLYAAVDANAQTPIPNVGLSDTLVNQGAITGAIAGGTLTIGGYGSFINQGSIAVSNGDTLLVSASSFANAGTVSVTGGATAIIGGPPDAWGYAPVWSNAGTIALAGGTLQFAGTVRSNQLGDIAFSYGTISLTGTLANGGTTLSLGSGGTLPKLSLNGTIQGGAITDPSGLLSIGTSGAAELLGVSDTGTLGLTQANAYLRIYDGLTLNGTANVTGAGAILAFQGTQAFNNSIINLGAASGTAAIDVVHDDSQAGGSTLTLGSNLRINQAGQDAAIGLATDLAGDGIINSGSITGAVAGGMLILEGASFVNRGSMAVSNGDTLALDAAAFSNTGSITVTNAGLSIGGSMTAAQLGSLALTNPAMSVTGTLNNTGNNLTIGTGSAWGNLTLSGTIVGGIIYDDGMGLLTVGNATLNNVSYRGTLNLSRPFQDLAIANGFHLNDVTGTQTGTFFLTGAADRVVATTTETLPDTDLYIGSNTVSYYGQHIAAPELDAGMGTTLTIGLSTTIRTAGTYSTLGDAALGQWSDTILNDGTILDATTSCTMTLDSSFFVNDGSVLINTGSTLIAADVGFTNNSVLAVTFAANLGLALYNYYAAPDAGSAQFTNNGTLRMLGGEIGELTGNGTFPTVPLLNTSTGLIQGLGSVLAPVLNNGIVESKFASVLALQQGVTGSGTMLIDQGCVLELANAVAASQTISFTSTSGTLKLETPLSFGAVVAGFGSSNILDIANGPVSTASISNGTLVLHTMNGIFYLNTPTKLAGTVAISSDGHGGSDITYTPRGNDPDVAAIHIAPPVMRFWAAPTMDLFPAPTWAPHDVRIGNWSNTDGLDVRGVSGATSLSDTYRADQGALSITDGTGSAHAVPPGPYPHHGTMIPFGHD